MDMRRKEDFLDRWRKCFGGAELPITCWYTDDEGTADPSEPAKGHRCLIADLAKIRKGESLRVYPLLEMDASRPRAVLGMYDVSARPFVPGSTLSFAVPVNKFAAMIDDMEESFLVTESWKAVRRRMG